MAKILGTNIIAPVVPLDEVDEYPSHRSRYGQGGIHVVNTLEERDQITSHRLELGMICYVHDIEANPSGDNPSIQIPKYYRLVDVSPPTWEVAIMIEIKEDLTPELGGEMDAGEHTIGFTEIDNYPDLDGKITIDWKNSNKQALFVERDTIVYFTDPSNPCNILLRITQEGSAGGNNISFKKSQILWNEGNKPNFTTRLGAIDIACFYFDGTNYYGIVSYDFRLPGS
jgi:hypothetical protein